MDMPGGGGRAGIYHDVISVQCSGVQSSASAKVGARAEDHLPEL